MARFPESPASGRAALRLAQVHFAAGAYADGIEVLEPLVAGVGTAADRERMLDMLGDGERKRERWEACRRWSLRLLAEYPDGDFAPHAHLRLGLALVHTGRSADGIEHLRRSAEDGRDAVAAEAHFNLGVVRRDMGELIVAAKHFVHASMQEVRGDFAPMCLFHAVDCFMRAKDADRAHLYLAQLTERFPNSGWRRLATREFGDPAPLRE